MPSARGDQHRWGRSGRGTRSGIISAAGAIFASLAAALCGVVLRALSRHFVIPCGAASWRPVAFKFRSKPDDVRWRKSWDWPVASGAIPALLFGVAVRHVIPRACRPFHRTTSTPLRGRLVSAKFMALPGYRSRFWAASVSLASGEHGGPGFLNGRGSRRDRRATFRLDRCPCRDRGYATRPAVDGRWGWRVRIAANIVQTGRQSAAFRSGTDRELVVGLRRAPLGSPSPRYGAFLGLPCSPSRACKRTRVLTFCTPSGYPRRDLLGRA